MATLDSPGCAIKKFFSTVFNNQLLARCALNPEEIFIEIAIIISEFDADPSLNHADALFEICTLLKGFCYDG